MICDPDVVIRVENLKTRFGDHIIHQDLNLGRVDKRDSQILLLLIQDCFLRISHGSRGFVGCGVGPDWAAAAA